MLMSIPVRKASLRTVAIIAQLNTIRITFETWIKDVIPLWYFPITLLIYEYTEIHLKPKISYLQDYYRKQIKIKHLSTLASCVWRR